MKLNDNPNSELSLLNIGIILGRTTPLSSTMLLRSEASIYHAFILKNEGNTEFSDPSLTSGKFSTSIYRSLTLSHTITLLPNAGAFLGYGSYTSAATSAHLRQGFDGFIIGPRFGFDVSFKFSNSFYIIASPEINIPVNDEENSESTLLFNIQLNF